MKSTFKILALALGLMLGFASCSKDIDDIDGTLYDALVTVKSDAAGKVCFQVNDDLVVYPSNMTTNPFNKEVKALTRFVADEKTLANNSEVRVMDIDSVLTKTFAPSVADNAFTYGSLPMEVYNDWLTCAEDGYVTIHFATYEAANYGDKHWMNLVAGENPENPYELVFHHKLDGPMTTRTVEGIVAFNIKDILPSSEEKVTLTIKFESFSGQKSFTLDAKCIK